MRRGSVTRASLSVRRCDGSGVAHWSELPIRKGEEWPLRFLFDPFFGQRASPSNYAGPMRRIGAPCSINELPELDYVCISHNQSVMRTKVG